MPKSKLRFVTVGVAFLGLSAVTASACSDSGNAPGPVKLSHGCTLNSECVKPLVCAFQRCHEQCAETRDCPAGERCVRSSEDQGDGGGPSGTSADGVCQLPVERGCTSAGSECVAEQRCAADLQCHDVCEAESDCVGAQLCTPSGACADTNEVDASGNIKGSGGVGGSGGSGGSSGTLGNAGDNGQSGGAGGDSGGALVAECPETTGTPTEHFSETISADARWTGLHLIHGGLVVNATLTLDPCTVVALDAGAYIVVRDNGSFKPTGSAGSPVVFTSSKSPPAAGDWSGISIAASAANDSALSNVIIEYAGKDASALRVEGSAKAALTDVLVRHTGPSRCGVELASGAVIASFDGVSTEDSEYSLCVAANLVGALESFTTDGPGINVAAETITSDATWKDFGRPYLLSNAAIVNGQLTLAPGVEVRLPPSGYFVFRDGGSLQSIGTAAKPVLFTSSKSPPAAGDWDALSFEATSSNDSRLENTIVEYGNGVSVMVAAQALLAVKDTTIRHSDTDGCALTLTSGARIPEFDGVTFTDTPCPISVSAGQVGDLTTFTTEGKDISVGAETITMPEVWTDNGAVYRLSGSMIINSSLEIQEGVTLKFPTGGYFVVRDGGSLKLLGTADAAVTLRSYIDDAGAGDWSGLSIEGTAATNCQFAHTLIRDAAQALIVAGRTVALDDCTFENNTCDVKLNPGGMVDATNTDFVACP